MKQAIQNPPCQILAIYKPKGPTSHDLIDQVRKITGVRKVGHAGTLDPLASGVLVIGIGRSATKQLSTIVAKEKEYIATIKFGITSSTDDAEGIASNPTLSDVHCGAQHSVLCNQKQITNTECCTATCTSLGVVQSMLKKFTGHIMQTPPIFSAIKIKGTSAHRLARQGQNPELKPRPVEIKKIEIINYAWPILTLRVITGPGVYIRALARDLGQALGVGAYLADLERTRVGEFTKEKTIPLENISKI